MANELKIVRREQTGRGPSRRLRASGRIPAVLYGESESCSLSIDQSEFRSLWKRVAGISTLIQVREDGKDSKRSLIKEVQQNPVTDEILHIDLQEVAAGVEMQIDVAIRLIGESSGVRNEGGLLNIHAHDVAVRCLPRHLPEVIELDVTELNIGSSLRLEDLQPLEGIEYLDDPSKTLVSCTLPAVDVEEVVEEEETEMVEGEGEGDLENVGTGGGEE
jgi:large subunit ribosomal protein L25